VVPFPLFFLLFVVTPLAEIALFIAVGDRIGLGPTLLLVLVTAFLGASLVSRQGRTVMAEARGTMRAGAFPGREIADGAMILVAGALLLTPGFLTDAVGFSLLVPGVRALLRRWGARRLEGSTVRLSSRVEYEPPDD
jgi:UPF0716 protein FxsA